MCRDQNIMSTCYWCPVIVVLLFIFTYVQITRERAYVLIANIHNSVNDEVAEWLRRWTANLMTILAGVRVSPKPFFLHDLKYFMTIEYLILNSL